MQGMPPAVGHAAIKAANDEILKQQTATLEKLDELEKAANEIRIYSKRG